MTGSHARSYPSNGELLNYLLLSARQPETRRRREAQDERGAAGDDSGGAREARGVVQTRRAATHRMASFVEAAEAAGVSVANGETERPGRARAACIMSIMKARGYPSNGELFVLPGRTTNSHANYIHHHQRRLRKSKTEMQRERMVDALGRPVRTGSYPPQAASEYEFPIWISLLRGL